MKSGNYGFGRTTVRKSVTVFLREIFVVLMPVIVFMEVSYCGLWFR